jgi:hypothetical protein
LLGFTADIPLSDSIDEVIEYLKWKFQFYYQRTIEKTYYIIV